ncbi:GNAT family N-acetyltransferase [Kitasatospora sp. NPDC002040]|uniref:GNAT family N-acetyltransferase n=1 Tax=Kitasatospora sp. NPDC002040 TaxID=3154661 RepID=UPI00332D2925
MSTSELLRANAFRTAFARRQATEVQEVPGGFLVLNAAFPLSYEHNQLHLDRAVGGPDALLALAERALAHADHRQLTLYDAESGAACVLAFEAAGYRHMTEVVMLHQGPVPVPSVPAEPVEVSELAPPYEARLRDWMPEASEATVEQLIARRAARRNGAPEVLFLGSRDTDGTVAAWADLYLDPSTGTAQIEDLVTALDHTGRGHGGTVLDTALHRAAAYPLRFLIADADDWPIHWYTRRGFTPIGECHSFTRG